MIEFSSLIDIPRTNETQIFWTSCVLPESWVQIVCDGWYLITGVANTASGAAFYRGDCEVRRSTYYVPLIAVLGPNVKNVKDGVVVGGTLSEQMMFERMIKRVPHLKHMKRGELYHRTFEL